jgi:hypothetical protein
MNSNRLEDVGVDIDQQASLYEQQLIDVYNRPRYYLDNFEWYTEYRVSWIDYKQTKITPLYKPKKNKRKVYK